MKALKADNSFNTAFSVSRLIILGVGFTAVLIFIVWYGLNEVEKRLRMQAVEQLESVLQVTHENLSEVWLEGLFQDAENWAKDPLLIENVEHLLKIQQQKNKHQAIRVATLLSSPAQVKIRQFFQNRIKRHDALGIFIIAPDHYNLASMRDENVGSLNLISKQRPERLFKVFEGKDQLVPPIYSDVPLLDKLGNHVSDYPTMFILAPVRNQAGNIIAAVAIRLDPYAQFSSIPKASLTGVTVEAYLFDSKGILLTDTRLAHFMREKNLLATDKPTILGIQLKVPGTEPSAEKVNFTQMAESAIAGNNGSSTESYLDYRGIPVLGVWKWNHKLDIGIATEIDELEALAAYRDIEQSIFELTIFVFLLSMLGMLIQYRLQLSAQKAIIKSENHLRGVMDNALDGIITINQKGIIQSINKATEMLFGYSREEVIGKNVRVLAAQPYRDAHDDYLNNYLKTGEKKVIGKVREVVACRKDGSTFPIRLGVSEVVEGYDRIFTGVIQDLTETKDAQKALEESEETFRRMASAANSAIVMLDSGGNISFWSRMAENIFGWSSAEVMGKNAHSILVPEDHIVAFEKAFPAFQKTGEGSFIGQTQEVIALNKEGVEFPVEIALSAVNIDGRWNAIGIINDITLRKRSEQDLRQLNQALEQSPVSVMITNLQGKIEYINQMFIKRTGYSKEQILGRNPKFLKSGNTSDAEYQALWETILRGEEWRGELLNKTRLGKLFWESTVISPMWNEQGVVTHFIAIKEDITDKKNAEAEALQHTKDIEKSYQDLEKSRQAALSIMQDANTQKKRAENALNELAESQHALKQAKEFAEQANQAKSSFLATMSHEIRTPMNAILGMSFLALQTELNTKQRGYIEKVNLSAESLLGILNDILDFSKIEAGKLGMESTRFRLDKVFENVANIVGLKAEEKGLEFIYDIAPDIPLALIGDPLRLGQILLNLGSNAVKFTEKGEVIISCQSVKNTEGQVTLEFSVKDSGIGLTNEQISKLFKAFSQADDSITRKYGGTGLGLTISKRLVEMMGGQISLKSTLGKGSVFTFTVVFSVGENQSEKVKILPEAILGIRALVVDDNLCSREILSQLLVGFGLNVKATDSGEKALILLEQAMFEGEPYSVVIIDWKMPGLDGLETVRRIQNIPELASTTAIIMVTAYNADELRQQAKDVSLHGVLVKPVSHSSLLDTLLEVFGYSPQKLKLGSTRITERMDSALRLRGAKILLVEDNEFNQELVFELLVNVDIQVSIANNGEEALQLLNTDQFDGVLMDVQMPVMGGLIATQKIRQQACFQNLPIIAMTAGATVEDREAAMQAGMNDYISKPINVYEMFSTMARWISPKLMVLAPVDKRKEKIIDEDEAFLTDLAGINLNIGLRSADGNHRLYRKLLKMFYKGQHKFVEHFSLAMNKGDSEEMKRLVHTLKGVAGNIGAIEVQRTSQRLDELCISNAETLGIKQQLKLVEGELAEVIDSIKKGFDQESKVLSERLAIDMSELSSQLQLLHQQLQQNNTDAVDTIENLIEACSGDEVRDYLEPVKKQINRYDFDEALKQLDLITSEHNLSLD